MFGYNFTKDPIRLGEYDEKYGQAWWAEVAEHAQPVKFNVMNRDNFVAGDNITCEERVEKQSAKGTAYYQLRKVKVGRGTVGQVTGVAVDEVKRAEGYLMEKPAQTQLDRIEAKIDKLLGEPEPVEKKVDVVIDPIEGEPIDLDGIPF